MASVSRSVDAPRMIALCSWAEQASLRKLSRYRLLLVNSPLLVIPKLRADNELGCPKRGWLVETESHERLFVIQAPMILRQQKSHLYACGHSTCDVVNSSAVWKRMEFI